MCAIEPPPAPISIRSMLGIRIGNPEPRLKRDTRAHSKLCAISGSPPAATHALAVVPPMSKARISSMPLLRAVLSADSTPPAGPDSSSRIGVSAAALPDVKPPLETMMRSGAPDARSCTRASSRFRYSATSGCTYALVVVVDMRSYSRISRAMPDEMETASPGKRFFTAAAICFSCTSLT